MKQKSSFLIYHEYREPLKLLTDEQRGRLLMALIDYSESGVVPELDGISMMAKRVEDLKKKTTQKKTQKTHWVLKKSKKKLKTPKSR